MNGNKDKKSKKEIIALAFGIFILIFCFPDIIGSIRYLLLKIPVLNKYLVNLDDDKYIQFMIMIITCCITGILSFYTYRLSKAVSVIQLDGQRAKQVLWANRVQKSISSNSTIIFKANAGLKGLEDLQCDESVFEDLINLHSNHVITDETKDILYRSLCLIKKIQQEYNNANEDKTTELIRKYCDEFLGDSGDKIGYNEKMRKIEDELKQISDGRESNV